ncbi:uncharacterized protein RHO25_004031 [Cercospora beticola]|uniref:DRBM domain-containing protein n=1 Tax=Cercospora beticola TaxID=122368 RepID=A0ABZ0NIU7_CERBT|nr:hypothetical protein RHO25_004031 [Cercospora beticola]
MQQRQHEQSIANHASAHPSGDQRTGDSSNLHTSETFITSQFIAPTSQDKPTDSIYYLRTCVTTYEPPLRDMMISGPYKYLSQVFHEARQYFGRDSQPGIRRLEDFVDRDGCLIPFERISSPIDRKFKWEATVECISREDPKLAERLPCTVWNVFFYEPEPGCPMARNMYIHGSSESKSRAEAAATQKLGSLLAEMGESLHMTQTREDADAFQGTVREVSGKILKWGVFVEKAPFNQTKANAEIILLDHM